LKHEWFQGKKRGSYRGKVRKKWLSYSGSKEPVAVSVFPAGGRLVYSVLLCANVRRKHRLQESEKIYNRLHFFVDKAEKHDILALAAEKFLPGKD
jgi:hypothetical protein